MPDQTPTPRTACVKKVEKGGGKTVYEVRGVNPDTDTLLSEYETEQEAIDAVKRYECEN
ncbi:hypothetical protein [Kushneria marisflavi]|uniref:Uncharacterized protein n=1 Tax=Kushneria marisflavi TaxID=157779 RepID=A0A240URP1_9GAMM|nr:hypothetical protein [Kushneria marisflavi]ART64177.1 hypothetical protein B9H00_14890 [Kushneria marisflavi]RKD76630.1 YaiA family uncharacterized protein [Kushneria marisflavi]